MLFAILTLFPEALDAYTRTSILGIAQEKGQVRIRLVDFRDFTRDRHRTVDDRPYGGGPGMVLKAEPIIECTEWLEREHGPFRKVLFTPDGGHFGQRKAEELARCERILLLCGRYEGFDERIRASTQWEELSIGDFVLSGGEIPALAVTEAVVRLLPGVLGNELSTEDESFQDGGGLDYPQYTRPQVFRGMAVPPVLLSGDHARIAAWRADEARRRTRTLRPDLIDDDNPSRHENHAEAEPTWLLEGPCT